MTLKRFTKTIIFLMLLTISMMSFAGEYTVIVNKANSVQEIKAKSLQKIFLGEDTTWPDGNRIKVAALNSGNLHGVFVKEILKMTTLQFSTLWKQKIFSGLGTGTDIKFFKTEDKLKEYIASTPEAIGYFSTNLLDDTINQVKIIME
ncbi:MAG TPA: hypothetical protein VK186_07090 [Candidatus Deferrimicrobium sp.]|nr:hypothetical protein [Candidatus Deferrimicrobium sp.]